MAASVLGKRTRQSTQDQGRSASSCSSRNTATNSMQRRDHHRQPSDTRHDAQHFISLRMLQSQSDRPRSLPDVLEGPVPQKFRASGKTQTTSRTKTNQRAIFLYHPLRKPSKRMFRRLLLHLPLFALKMHSPTSLLAHHGIVFDLVERSSLHGRSVSVANPDPTQCMPLPVNCLHSQAVRLGSSGANRRGND